MEKKEIKGKKTFCIVGESFIQRYRLLSFITTLNSVETNANCIIACRKETEELIKSFPLKFTIKIHFITIRSKEWKFIDMYKYILRTIKYCVEKFGSCIFIRDNLILVRKIEISDEIKKQGYGFHKRLYEAHLPEINMTRFHSEIVYVNNLEFVNNIEELLEIPDFHRKGRFTKKEKKIFQKNVVNIEYKYVEKYKTKYLFPYETLITTEDFFSFEPKIEIKNITSNLMWKDKKISVFGVRMEKPRPQMKQLNQELLKLILKYNIFYSNIIQLSNPNIKIKFMLPVMKNIGIWNRQIITSGMYEIIEMFEKEYPNYCSKEIHPNKFFSVNKYALIDKPHANFLCNDIYQYYSILSLSYSGPQLKIIKNDRDITNHNFGFYFFEKPKWLDEYFNEHKEILHTLERNKESCVISQQETLRNSIFINGKVKTGDEIIDILTDTKFVFFEKFDTNLMVLCFALGCIPVFESLDVKPYELECNKHYCFVDLPEEEEREKTYEKMRKNVLDYYEQNISPKNAFKKLVNHLFIRDIQ